MIQNPTEHPLWDEFTKYLISTKGIDNRERSKKDWEDIRAFWWGFWQTFLAGADAENKRIESWR